MGDVAVIAALPKDLFDTPIERAKRRGALATQSCMTVPILIEEKDKTFKKIA